MNVEKISYEEAAAFLLATQRYRLTETWDAVLGWVQGEQRKRTRNARGAGAKGGLVNYGLRNANGKLIAVQRIGAAPYQNNPAKAAVGVRLAPRTAYLSRQGAVGISGEDLIEFIQACVLRLRSDTLAYTPYRVKRHKSPHDFRYLLSLDDPNSRAIEGFKGLIEAAPATGKCYVASGALWAGWTKTTENTTRLVGDDCVPRSIYQNGKTIRPAASTRTVKEGKKARFVWVLAENGSQTYAEWRRALPHWVREAEWGVNGLGWIQPRLIIKRDYLGVAAEGQITDLVRLAIASFGHLLGYGETLTGEAFAERIAQVYDAENPRTRAVLAGLV